jgi:putative serine protease PepD
VPASTGDDESENGTDPLRQLLSWNEPEAAPAASAVQLDPGAPAPDKVAGADATAEPPGSSATAPGVSPEPTRAGAEPPPQRWAAPENGFEGYVHSPYQQPGHGGQDYVQLDYGPVQSPGQPVWPQFDWQEAQWPPKQFYGELPQPRPPRRPPRALPGWLGVAILAAVVGAVVGSSLVAVFASRAPQTIVREYFPGTTGTVKVGDVQSILASVLPAVVSIDTSSLRDIDNLGDYVEGAGTGMIIEPSGVILTNNHVVAGAETVTVTFYGQVKRFPAKVIGVDAQKDIALVQVEGAGDSLPVVHLGNSNSAQQGDGVLAIGNALALAGGPTVTEGIVSALDRSLIATTDEGTSERLTGLIQTDAPINPGNSGGPLVDSSGQVVAMNTAVATSSAGNAPAQNVGFGIAVDEIRTVVAQILHHPVRP